MTSEDQCIVTAREAWSNGEPARAFASLAPLFSKGDTRRFVCLSAFKLIQQPTIPPTVAPPTRGKLDQRAELDRQANAVTTPTNPARCKTLCHCFMREAASVPSLESCIEETRAALDSDASDTAPIRIAVLGTFSVGKSSLLNALLGSDVLATGNVPVTAVMTTLRWGSEPRALWIDATGHQHVKSLDEAIHATDDRSEQRAAVTQVVIELPSPLLRDVTLIDTPGLDSGIDEHDAALPRIIADADAVFWVFNATRAGSERERKDLGLANSQTGITIGIVNQIDAIRPKPEIRPERWASECNSVLQFLKDQLGSGIEQWVLASARWIETQDERGGLEGIRRAITLIANRRDEIRLSAQRRALELGARRAIALRNLVEKENTQLKLEQQRWTTAADQELQFLRDDWQEELHLATRKVSQTGSPYSLTCEGAKAILRVLAPKLMGINKEHDEWTPQKRQQVHRIWTALDLHAMTVSSSPNMAELWKEVSQRLSRSSRSLQPQPMWSESRGFVQSNQLTQFLMHHNQSQFGLTGSPQSWETKQTFGILIAVNRDTEALGEAFIDEFRAHIKDWKGRLTRFHQQTLTKLEIIKWSDCGTSKGLDLIHREHPLRSQANTHPHKPILEHSTIIDALNEDGISGVERAIKELERDNELFAMMRFIRETCVRRATIELKGDNRLFWAEWTTLASVICIPLFLYYACSCGLFGD